MNKESIIAIIRIMIPAICAVLGVLGYSVDSESVTNVVLVIAGGVLSIYTGWKNNNVTQKAQEAQQILDESKAKDA